MMTKQISKYRLLAPVVALLAVLAAGCEPADQGKTVSTPKTDQAEIDRINNSNIPPQAKAAALQGMKDGKANAERMQRPGP
jgi:hypothetical protein